MECHFRFHKLGRVRARWVLVVLLVAVTHLLFQSLLLPYGKALRSLLPEKDDPRDVNYAARTARISTKYAVVRNPLTVNASELIDTSTSDDLDDGGDLGSDTGGEGDDRFEEFGFTLDEEKGLHRTSQDLVDRYVDDTLNSADKPESLALISMKNEENDFVLSKASKDRRGFPLDQTAVEPNIEMSTENIRTENIDLRLKKSDGGLDSPFQPSPLASSADALVNASFSTTSTSSVSEQSGLLITNNHSAIATTPGVKKMRCNMPPKSITTFQEMNQILVRHRAKSRSLRPRWSSVRDKEILAMKPQIENAPLAMNDQELYAPLFRNVSMFKRSYELMERTLKVYVYKDGDKPIFHQPIMKGLYASEGWFMKLMERNRRYVVKDPRRAHLFYMPFSSRMLEHVLYVRNSHNRTNLRQYLKEYSEKLAAKYPYWNRTGGADHFLVACHDWAPYETRHHMERCMKALCNADVTSGFKIGRDVSFPETYVRSARNPLRDLGGKPPSRRHVLAFYAGNIHGYLRPILLKYWKDKDPDMKIFGPMPPGQILYLPQGVRGQ
ncbi:probable glycosyltransferase At5g03795 [Morus notabilis]|uniref:probable glycosyltransferase At5g03795 n=1 Tax=Morus notabilis TaxID=981085 RepID=UPI000CED708B|nr:probable glycosyltransferase At5g03795 [Morus notabilis]